MSNQNRYLAANYQTLTATAMFDVELIREKLDCTIYTTTRYGCLSIN